MRIRREHRRGIAVVEMAFGLPIFLLFVFALIWFGHLQLVNNMLQAACRNAARVGAIEGTTTADIVAHVQSVLAPVVETGEVDIIVKDAGAYDASDVLPQTAEEFADLPDVEVGDMESRDMFLVRATVNYRSVALIPIMPFSKDVVLVGQTFARHE